jgi:hypothetical protein
MPFVALRGMWFPYLMDTAVKENTPDDQALTDYWYGGDQHTVCGRKSRLDWEVWQCSAPWAPRISACFTCRFGLD